MKKLVFAFGALFAISLFSCLGGNQQDNQQPVPNDTVEPQPVDSVMQVTGVAIDGAMNSISLVVGEDTVNFSYPDLDREHRASWDINDTVTVRYYVTENGDSVTDVINEAGA